MKSAKRIAILFVVAMAVLMTAGCPKDPYRASIQGSKEVSDGVAAAITITSSYYTSSAINDSQKAAIGNFLNTVTDCNIKFRASVVAAHNAGQTGISAFLPIADSFVQCAEVNRSVMSDLKVYNILKAVDTAINGVALAVASAKQPLPPSVPAK
jgi:hypothetical protein